jgi:uncharacterized protein (TIGR03067 family)
MVGEVSSEELQKDSKQLQGRWQFVAVEDASGKSDEVKRNLDKIFWIFEGDIMKWEAGNDGSHPEMRFRLHFMDGRRCIDLTAVGSDSTKVGIYEIERDNLRICICRNAEKPRPSDFTSKSGTENLVVSLKRVKG